MADDTLKLPHDIWLVVADGEKALFLRNKGDALHPNLEVIREMKEENPPTREQGADRPGRMHDAGGQHRSAVDDTDWHRAQKEKFADEIAERLYRCAHRGDYEKVVIVAPPVVLGELRHKMHKEVTDRVVAEIPKTLTGHPVYEIEKLIAA